MRCNGAQTLRPKDAGKWNRETHQQRKMRTRGAANGAPQTPLF